MIRRFIGVWYKKLDLLFGIKQKVLFRNLWLEQDEFVRIWSKLGKNGFQNFFEIFWIIYVCILCRTIPYITLHGMQ